MEDDATILHGIESIGRAAVRCRELFLVNKSAVSSEAPMFLPFMCVFVCMCPLGACFPKGTILMFAL